MMATPFIQWRRVVIVGTGGREMSMNETNSGGPVARATRPGKQGLYDPQFEHDACGVGFVVDIQGRKSNKILRNAIEVLKNLDHRGACGAETNTGDGEIGRAHV